jgi:hypothetical protein
VILHCFYLFNFVFLIRKMNLNQAEKQAALTLIDLALREDVGSGDITTDNLIPAGDQTECLHGGKG